MRGWICKVTGNTDFLTTVRTCGCLILVKTRLFFHLVSVWFYRLEGFGTPVSVPRANRWFLPCVSPVGFIYCIPYARFTIRCSSKVSLFGNMMAGAKGNNPRLVHFPSGYHFHIFSYIPKGRFSPEFTVQLPFTSESGSRPSSFHVYIVGTNNRDSGKWQFSLSRQVSNRFQV